MTIVKEACIRQPLKTPLHNFKPRHYRGFWPKTLPKTAVVSFIGLKMAKEDGFLEVAIMCGSLFCALKERKSSLR